MFEIKSIKTEVENVIELKDTLTKTKARINLNYGACLESLFIQGTEIISNLILLDQKYPYPSSILFPFANRINKGEYDYEGYHYSLPCNEKSPNNAIHGLVYDKPFILCEMEALENFAEIKIIFEEMNPIASYPFQFRMQLCYKLTKDKLSFKINITNLGSKKLPFTLGWHPYFRSINLSKSYIKFSSTKKIKCNTNKITVAIEEFNSEMPLCLNNKAFDDAFILDDSSIEFYTPQYDMTLTSSEKENFLQLYTPDNTNAIAIEPMTGVSDSFNNKIGLKELSPGKSYEIEWLTKVKVKHIIRD